MKIGLILECGPKGADIVVYKYLIEQIRPDVEIKSYLLGNKRDLIKECGKTVGGAFKTDQCDYIFIIWDLYPGKHEKNASRPCIREDCEKIRESLVKAELTSSEQQKIHLICMVKELETLFLFDEKAIVRYLESRKKNLDCRVKKIKNPEYHDKPKEILINIFYEHIKRGYQSEDAEGLIMQVNIKKLEKSQSFQRFKAKLLGI